MARNSGDPFIPAVCTGRSLCKMAPGLCNQTTKIRTPLYQRNQAHMLAQLENLDDGYPESSLIIIIIEKEWMCLGI